MVHSVNATIIILVIITNDKMPFLWHFGMKFKYFPLSKYFHIIPIASAIMDDKNKYKIIFIKFLSNAIRNIKSTLFIEKDVRIYHSMDWYKIHNPAPH